MNKERAKEELKLMRDNLKMDLQETQTTYWTDTKTTYDKRVELLTDSIQALDIAIESLEQNIQTIRVEREFDISELDKGTDYLLTKITEDFVREFVKANVLEMIASETRDIHKTKAIFEVKVVEPYERKE